VLTGTAGSSSVGDELRLDSPRLAVDARGTREWRRELAPPRGVDQVRLASFGASADEPLCLARFPGSPLPTALVALTTGGAHCCLVVRALDAEQGSWRRSDHDLGDAGAHLELLSEQAAIVTADTAFAYRFADYAASGLPVLVFEDHGGRLADVTRHHQALLREDAGTWWSAAGADPEDPLGDLAAWTADECRLGLQATSERTLSQLAAAGRLSPAPVAGAIWPTGTAFVRSVEEFLAARGYCRPLG
jgi:hypothetical protein